VLRALQAAPANRFQTAASFHEALLQVLVATEPGKDLPVPGAQDGASRTFVARPRCSGGEDWGRPSHPGHGEDPGGAVASGPEGMVRSGGRAGRSPSLPALPARRRTSQRAHPGCHCIRRAPILNAMVYAGSNLLDGTDVHQICIVRPDGSDLTRVSPESETQDLVPVWVPRALDVLESSSKGTVFRRFALPGRLLSPNARASAFFHALREMLVRPGRVLPGSMRAEWCRDLSAGCGPTDRGGRRGPPSRTGSSADR
jgi:hypothetical protein